MTDRVKNTGEFHLPTVTRFSQPDKAESPQTAVCDVLPRHADCRDQPLSPPASSVKPPVRYRHPLAPEHLWS